MGIAEVQTCLTNTCTEVTNAKNEAVAAKNAAINAQHAAESAIPSGSVHPIEVQATSDGQTTFTLNVALQSISFLTKGNGAVIVSSKRSVSGTTMTIDSTANIVNGEILAGWGVTQ